ARVERSHLPYVRTYQVQHLYHERCAPPSSNRDLFFLDSRLTLRLELKNSSLRSEPRGFRTVQITAAALCCGGPYTERRSPECVSMHSLHSDWPACSLSPLVRVRVRAVRGQVQRNRPRRTPSSAWPCPLRPHSVGSQTGTPSRRAWRKRATRSNCSTPTTTSPPNPGRSTR